MSLRIVDLNVTNLVLSLESLGIRTTYPTARAQRPGAAMGVYASQDVLYLCNDGGGAVQSDASLVGELAKCPSSFFGRETCRRS